MVFCARVNDNSPHVQRPVDDAGNRVTPAALEDHRVSNVFRGPSCLCAYTAGDAYTESAIYMAVDGSNFGEYVASCATGRCGYLSMYIFPSNLTNANFCLLVNLESVYSKRGLSLRLYAPRGTRLDQILI
jgi:hypothetical protein